MDANEDVNSSHSGDASAVTVAMPPHALKLLLQAFTEVTSCVLLIARHFQIESKKLAEGSEKWLHSKQQTALLRLETLRTGRGAH